MFAHERRGSSHIHSFTAVAGNAPDSVPSARFMSAFVSGLNRKFQGPFYLLQDLRRYFYVSGSDSWRWKRGCLGRQGMRRLAVRPDTSSA